MADWNKITSVGNVDDRRRAGPLLLGGGGLGVAGVVIVMLVNLLAGGSVDVGSALNQLQGATAGQQTDTSQFAGEDDYEKFARTVLGSTNDTWGSIFTQSQEVYEPPRLVLFRGYTTSGCGGASSQVGPHYCPADSTIYLDETFFDELVRRYGAAEDATGDVAQAYVIAHEVGHHIQNQLGTTDQISGRLQSGTPESNEISINIELQADCFAGVWAHSVQQLGVFQPGEIKEALDAAASVGDDHIQKSVQGRVNPESWTHGSSEQRVHWFNSGFKSGQPSSCDTFAARG